LSPTEWGALGTLVSDGGELSPKQIAEATGFYPDSIRRGLNRIDGLVEREYGFVNLCSSYVAELFHDAVIQAREQTQWTVEAGTKALQAAERGLDENTSAFIAWAAKHGVNLKEGREDISLKLG